VSTQPNGLAENVEHTPRTSKDNECEKQRRIASSGGKVAHAKGLAHE